MKIVIQSQERKKKNRNLQLLGSIIYYSQMKLIYRKKEEKNRKPPIDIYHTTRKAFCKQLLYTKGPSSLATTQHSSYLPLKNKINSPSQETSISSYHLLATNMKSGTKHQESAWWSNTLAHKLHTSLLISAHHNINTSPEASTLSVTLPTYQ